MVFFFFTRQSVRARKIECVSEVLRARAGPIGGKILPRLIETLITNQLHKQGICEFVIRVMTKATYTNKNYI